MKRIKRGMVVTAADGRRGVTVDDLMNCCSPAETPVVYEGESAFLGTDTKFLMVVGPENAVAVPDKCGAGRGAECCIFLVCGAGGFECQRHGEMRYALIFKTMDAKRDPVAPYPACQLPESEP